MNRNDRILLYGPVTACVAVVLVAFAPPLSPSYAIATRLWLLANSNFFTALAGAFAGAFGAQIIFERTSKRKSLLGEIREIGAAIAICNAVTNAYMMFKKQIVRDVCTKYRNALMQRKEIENALRAGRIVPAPLRVAALDLRMFVAPFAPIEALQRALQERIRPEGPALALLPQLTQAISSLDSALAARNELIDIMQKAPTDYLRLEAIYFGSPIGNVVDGSYPSHIDAVAELTDDCIGIGIVLEKVLQGYASKLRGQYGADAPKILKTEWLDPSLIPNLRRYEGWLEESFGQQTDNRADRDRP